MLTLLPNEPVWLAAELNLNLPPAYKGFHRYQVIQVNRNDKIVTHLDDLGPAELFTAPEFRFPVLWEHTVGEVLDICEEQRFGSDRLEQRLRELQSESTLFTDFVERAEKNRKIKRNQSQFGPRGKTQRNAYSLTAYEDVQRK